MDTNTQFNRVRIGTSETINESDVKRVIEQGGVRVNSKRQSDQIGIYVRNGDVLKIEKRHFYGIVITKSL